MPITRDNHYVPIWYQRGFLEPDCTQLAYRDLKPDVHQLPDGRLRPGSSRFKSSPKQCFFQRDLYTTAFGDLLNDEIERLLFGKIDADGAPAIRSLIGEDPGAWHKHFGMIFRFIDSQKLRTPKGLDWLKMSYPRLSQNELMMEMQGIQAMHCTIWTEGVREIVSAADSEVKFIISDHPVTIYNHGVPPDADGCRYPLDPSIALKGSQTIYPLDRDHCLILTNFEYAKDKNAAPIEKRTFARNFRTSITRTDAFARTRRLSADDVRRINRVIKARAHRYIAAGREEWLDPEVGDVTPWDSLREMLRPPKEAIWRFGGELFAGFEDGRVYYQDAFGRTEKESDFLKKPPPKVALTARDVCGCGSGKSFSACCQPLPQHLRPIWTERGIRERNLMLYRGIEGILGLDKAPDWLEVRRALSDEQIRDVHSLYQALWPIETDILQLLPKPDGRPRAVYTGFLHPSAIMEFAFGSALYFGELIIESPFPHAANMRPEFSPIHNPRSYHQDFIKNVVLFLKLMPLVELGYVNLIPNPTVFDTHLHHQMMQMAKARSAGSLISPDEDKRTMRLMDQDHRRSLMSMPEEYHRAQWREMLPDLDAYVRDAAIAGIRRLRELDPLAAVQEGLMDGGKDSGQYSSFRMAPNFEMALYLAQATGASIVTDSPHRWKEVQLAVLRQGGCQPPDVAEFARALAATPLGFVNEIEDYMRVSATGAYEGYGPLFRDVFNCLSELGHQGAKPNWDAQLASRLEHLNREAQRQMRQTVPSFTQGVVRGIFPTHGIQHNNVNRLLLMSSSEHHLPSVPMAFFIEPAPDQKA
ncbi:DUF4238 domain-containing protein [Myxococcus sp. AM010]|uniref:DUF4238 domain-containing protein n=1 Tax=Myxococcus sp. AM010 TaxID=2745138 RepID=UPI0015952814|nr:DUF4238 domain-containing protein [Myxococcus sp. AM010]NVJ18995.1 DUF4238 domain-containing protein [Myxococcus sp. AM010]